MKKRIAGILALTLAFATLLGGCGSKMTADDAKSYAQACLDASYKGEFDEYLSQTDSTKEEAQEMYDNGINLTMEASDIENSGVSQELQDKYRQMFIDLYKSADYTLDNAKEDGEDGFTVDVTVKPFRIFEGLDDELNAKLEEIAEYIKLDPSRQFVSSDLGMSKMPNPVDGLRDCIRGLRKVGLSDQQLDTVTRKVPAFLLGLD